MPRLPGPEDYGVSIARPSRGVAEISPIREQATPEVGQALVGIGDIFKKEAESLEDTIAQDALNKLQEKQLELSHGENGFTKKVGAQVVEKPVIAEYGALLKQSTEGFAQGITSPRAKERFNAAAAASNRAFTASLYKHVADQTESYKDLTAKKSLEVAAGLAASGRSAEGMLKAQQTAEEVIARKGLEGDAADEYRRESIGLIHGTVINKLVEAGAVDDAKAYYEANKKDMALSQQAKIDPLIKSSSDFQVAKSLANEAWQMVRDGKPGSEVEKLMTEKAKDRQQYQMAQEMLGQFERAKDREDRQVMGGLMDTFLQGPSHKTANDIYATEEFRTLEKDKKRQVREYFINHIEAANNRAEAAMLRAERKAEREERKAWKDFDNSPEALSTFSMLYENPDLGAWTPAIIKSYAPMVGDRNVAALMKHSAELKQGAKSFHFTQGQIDAILPQELQKPIAPELVRQKKAFKTLADRALIEWKELNPGKVPDEDTQMQIMRAANQEYKEVGGGIFGGDILRKGYEVKPDMKNIKAMGVPVAYAATVRAEAKRQNVELSDQDIAKMWEAKQKARK